MERLCLAILTIKILWDFDKGCKVDFPCKRHNFLYVCKDREWVKIGEFCSYCGMMFDEKITSEID